MPFAVELVSPGFRSFYLMGLAVIVAFWTRIKVLSSSFFSARHQSAQFLFVAVFRALNNLIKISNLYMS